MAVRDSLVLSFEVDGNGKMSTVLKDTEGKLLGVHRASGQADTSVRGYSNAMSVAKAAVTGYLSLQTVRKLAEQSDAWKNLSGQLKAQTSHLGDLASNQATVLAVAKDTDAQLDATGQLYSRMARSTKELITDQGDLASIVGTVNKELVVNGTTSAEASGALIQLSQAFNAGKLAGEEYRSMSENLPTFLDAIAESMGVEREALKKLASESKITSKVMIDALQSMEEETTQKFNDMERTVGRATTSFNTNLTEYIGKSEEVEKATTAMITVIDLAAEHIETLGTVAAVAGGILTTSLVGGLVSSTAKMMMAAGVVGTLTKALKLLGGPVGILFLASGSLAAWAKNTRTAADETGTFTSKVRAFIRLLLQFENDRTPFQKLADEIEDANDKIFTLRKSLGDSRSLLRKMSKDDPLFEETTRSVEGLKKQIAFLEEFVKKGKTQLENFGKAGEEAGEGAKKAGDQAEDAAGKLKKFYDQLDPAGKAALKATSGLGGYTQSLYDAQAASDILAQKQAILWEFYQDTGNIEVYNEETKKLGLSMETTAEKTVTSVSHMDQIWGNFIENTQGEWGDFVYGYLDKSLTDGEFKFSGFRDSIYDMWVRLLADMVAAWSLSGVLGLLSGQGWTGFSFGGDKPNPATTVAGSVAQTAAGQYVSGAIGASSVGGAVVNLAGGVNSALGSSISSEIGFLAGDVSAGIPGLTYASGGGSVVTSAGLGTAGGTAGVGTGAATIESLGAASSSSAGLGSTVAGLGVLGVAAIAGFAMQAKNAKELAKVAEEVNTKWAATTNRIETNKIKFGEWGNEAVAITSATTAQTELLHSAMQSVGVGIERGANGTMVLSGNIENARLIAEQYDEQHAAMMERQLEDYIEFNKLNDEADEIAEQRVAGIKAVGEAFAVSVEFINSANFDGYAQAVATATASSISDFRALSDDATATTAEINQVFGALAPQIISHMGGASSISIAKLGQILESSGLVARGTLSKFAGANSGIVASFEEMAKAANSKIDSIKTNVTTSVDTYHTIYTRRSAEGGDGYAAGTNGRFVRVPSGYPNDSYPIWLESDEDFLIRTPADRQRGVGAGGAGIASHAGGNSQSDELLNKIVFLLSQHDQKLDRAANLGQKQVDALDRAATATERRNSLVDAGRRR